MIVICPECGGKNRIPDTPDTGKTYRCFGCKQKLAYPGATSLVSASGSALSSSVGSVGLDASLATEPVVASSCHLGVLSRIRLRLRENRALVFLALIALALHLVVIPANDVLLYDEQFYVLEARSIIGDDGLQNLEHPTLGKLFVVLGMTVFGDNTWGWRAMSVLFSVVAVVVFYLVCRSLAGGRVAFLAGLFFVFENMVFLFSGLAQLDVFAMTFMFLAFLLYLRQRYVLSGVALALAGLCKMTGLFGGFVLLAHWLIFRKPQQSPRTIVLFAVSGFVTFMALMPFLDFAATGEWLNPADRVAGMVVGHESLTFDSVPPELLSVASYPWEWVLGLRREQLSDGSNVFVAISQTVWILIIPSIGYALYTFVRRRTEVSLFILLWFSATYLSWVLVVAYTNRVTYLFYFYPTVGAVCLAIGVAASGLWGMSLESRFGKYRFFVRGCVVAYLAFHIILFLSLSSTLWAFGLAG